MDEKSAKNILDSYDVHHWGKGKTFDITFNSIDNNSSLLIQWLNHPESLTDEEKLKNIQWINAHPDWDRSLQQAKGKVLLYR